MTDHTEGSRAADVLRLDCARFEADLAEGRVVEAHLATCDRCRDALEGMRHVGEQIARATAPAHVPDGFEAAVLARAEHHAGFPVDARRRGGWTRWVPLAAGGALAAALAMAFWAGGATERARDLDRPLRVERTAPAPEAELTAPETAAADEAPVVAESPTAPVRLLPRPAPQPAQPAPRPVVPAASPVPEPAFELPDALRGAIEREIGRVDHCPQSSGGSVRVTVTVLPDGTLKDRQVLSLAAASDAHHCVGSALDKLLLPPMNGAATVTIDVTW